MKQNYAILMTILLVISFLLRLSGLDQINLIGDEYQDFSIAVNIKQNLNPFESGHVYESTALDQTRFSHYIAAFLLFWKFDTQGARIISIIFGVLTILLVYFIGKELYNKKIGLIASLLTTFSIYHLSFSRFAMTSGDSIFLFFYLLSTYFFYKGINGKNNNYLFVAAVLTGVSIATKLFGILLFPSYLIIIWLSRKKFGLRPDRKLLKQIFISAFPITIYLIIFFLPPNLPKIKLYLYFLSVAFILFYTYWLLFSKSKFMNLYVPANFAILAILYMFTLTPTHLSLTNFVLIFNWFSEWNSSILASAPYYESLIILFIRLSIPIALLFLVSFAYLIKKRKELPNTYLLVFLIIPFLFLTLIKWKVTWHLMIIFPIVYLIIAKAFYDFMNFIRKNKVLFYSSIILFIFILFFPFYNTSKIYPYYELDGYQYGDRHIGYNHASFLSFEGVSYMNDYLELNIPDDKIITFYLLDEQKKDYEDYIYENFMYYPKRNPERYAALTSKHEIELKKFDYLLLHFYSVSSVSIPERCILNYIYNIDTIKVFYLYDCTGS